VNIASGKLGTGLLVWMMDNSMDSLLILRIPRSGVFRACCSLRAGGAYDSCKLPVTSLSTTSQNLSTHVCLWLLYQRLLSFSECDALSSPLRTSIPCLHLEHRTLWATPAALRRDPSSRWTHLWAGPYAIRELGSSSSNVCPSIKTRRLH
jgi:hypothetical protein